VPHHPRDPDPPSRDPDVLSRDPDAKRRFEATSFRSALRRLRPGKRRAAAAAVETATATEKPAPAPGAVATNGQASGTTPS
jgi:hypothetical protein